jgi:hypothetical protein
MLKQENNTTQNPEKPLTGIIVFMAVVVLLDLFYFVSDPHDAWESFKLAMRCLTL